jgi:5-methylcytosine-specific restriction protein A
MARPITTGAWRTEKNITPEQREARKAYHREWSKEDKRKNPEKYRERWTAANDRRAEINKQRPFRAMGWRRGVPAIVLAGIYRRQRGLCALTGRRLTAGDMQLDHILPEARGGTNDPANLRWVCKAANEAKSALLDDELYLLCEEILARRVT